ncbi:aldehyde dehydrogenase [Conexibacter sp. DBS9H8]|uniref:aldehyde dehydrogenase n=1 Tax=Conexibacter sp. DBS9H8 TaxID=2937801 RepID=UPI00200BDD5C|nr:aldehyde dehydrogenase [Conexibacter sp. DBS9H8]
MKRFSLYIGGEFVDGNGPTIASENPYSRRTWAEFNSADTGQVDAAVNAAQAASSQWRRSSGVTRAALMFRLAELLERDADELAEIETLDNGKIIRETRNQIRFAARNYRYYAGLADKMYGETKQLDNVDMLNYTVREPHGAVALLTAWNSPISLLSNKLPPALACGNTAVIKPSEFASVSTLAMAQLVAEAGFPAGVINVLAGTADVGRALVSHPKINMVSFTGSVGVGRAIAHAAAESLIPVALELGGKSANVIFADAVIENAVSGAVAGIFAAAGQTCVAGSRLLVDERVYDEVTEGVLNRASVIKLGDPLDEATEMGPIATVPQYERIRQAISDAVSEGATLALGGAEANVDGEPLFVPPTVLTGVSSEMRVAQEEIFGPVLSIQSFTTEAEAVEIANATPFGLAGGVWTSDLSRAHRVSRELACGMVWVNTYRATATQAPFGGFGHSGYGRERGTEAIESYTRIKNTMIDTSGAARDPFLLKT